jgi:hypothetical protein
VSPYPRDAIPRLFQNFLADPEEDLQAHQPPILFTKEYFGGIRFALEFRSKKTPKLINQVREFDETPISITFS